MENTASNSLVLHQVFKNEKDKVTFKATKAWKLTHCVYVCMLYFDKFDVRDLD